MTTNNKKLELKRVNINLPLSLIQKVERYALSKGLNTTSAYIVLLNYALDNHDMLTNLPLIMELAKHFQSKDSQNSIDSLKLLINKDN